MKQTKSFIVEGDVKTYNGKRIHNIAEKVDAEVNTFLANLEGDLVDVRIAPTFQGASGDFAFVTVIYEGKAAPIKGKK